MIFMIIVRKIKSFFCIVFYLFQRCFCCFKRKLHNDCSLPIAVETAGLEVGSQSSDNSLTNWDSWDGLSSVVTDGMQHSKQKGTNLTPLQQQIHEYRLSQQRKLSETPEISEEPNYFEDLKPKISHKSKIVILSRPEEEQHVSNRIALSLTDPVPQGPELLEWTEDNGRGWEEESEQDLNVDALLRQQKEQMRQEKRAERLKRKADKEINKHSTSKLATKLS